MIHENIYADINGIRQYLQIRGSSLSNPVMIFIHGGPFFPSAYMTYKYNQEAEKFFTIINYDQRGCGRTFFENKDGGYADVDMLIEDLHQIIAYAKERFGQKKAVISGHSWGSELGTLYVKKYPEDVMCYIGISQVTSLHRNKLNLVRKFIDSGVISKKAHELKAREAARRMEEMTEFSPAFYKELEIIDSVLEKYSGGSAASRIRNMLSAVTSPDIELRDIRWFLKLFNVEKILMKNSELTNYAFFGFDAENLIVDYDMPVYFISGGKDSSVCQEDAKEYFNRISAPRKEFFNIGNAGHSVFLDCPDEYTAVLRKIYNELEY